MLHATRRQRLRSSLLVIAIALVVPNRPAAAPAPVIHSPGFGAIAPAFVRNTGYADASARFVAVGGGRPVFFTDDDVRIVDPARRASLWLTFVNGRVARVEGDSPTGGAVSYIRRGSEGERLPTYRDVVYRRLWPGIDARVSGIAEGVEYSFEIAPHAEPQLIHLRYRGADRVTLGRDGQLLLETGGTTIVDRAPTAYQRINGRMRPVPVRFERHGDDLSFALGAYDRSRPLVIDPTLIYSTYLGSSGYDDASAVAVDHSGAAYVTGRTAYTDFPATPGAYRTTSAGSDDAFVAKINPAGTHFEYVTYLGGSSSDFGTGIAVDAGGNAYVTGRTTSDNFPTTPGATPKRSGIDGFLTKLNANGSGLVYSTFFGTGFDTRVAGVAVDAAGNAYVAGTTQSIYVPVTSGGRTFAGVNNDNAFLLKFNATGQVTYGTYLGGMSSDVATGVAVDGAGHAYVVGNTWLSRDGIAMSRTGTPAQPDPNSAIFKSTDGAQTFVPANHGLDSSIAMAVAIDPQQPDTIYQATYDGGMFKSTDGGGSWLPINSGFGIRPSAWDIAVNPNTPSTLLAIVYSESTNGIRSVFRSLDAGGSWTEVLDDARIIAIAPSSPSIVYATASGGSLARSTDSGSTWTRVPFPTPATLAVDPTNASVVYGGTGDGVVMKSSTGGNTWSSVIVEPGSARPIRCLAVDPTSPNTVWAGNDVGRVFKSSDGGTTWAVQPPAGQALAGPAVMTFDGGTLYIGYTSSSSSGNFSVARTTDKGASWTPLTVRGNQMPVRDLAARNGVVFLATQAFSDGFLFKVDTNAASNSIMWGTYVGGSLDDAAVGVAVDPAGNPVVAIRTTSHDVPNTAATDYRPSAVARVSSDGSSYTVSSYAGPAAAGPGSGGVAGIAVDTNGVAYITGQQNDSGSDKSIFVDRVEPAGATTAEYVLNGSRSNVGSIADWPTGIAVDGSSGVYVTGSTSTYDFPTTPNAPQPFYGSGASDAFISKVSFSDVGPPPDGTNIALNKTVVVSSIFSPEYAGAYAVDGSPTTRWSSVFSDPQWIYVDLGQTYAISEVVLRWETAFGADYQVQVSDDAAAWTTIASVTNGDGSVDDLSGLSGSGRYVRILGTRRGTQWGYSLWELEVFGSLSTPPPGLPAPWSSGDIGAVGVAGSASYNSGVFTVKGSGADIWGTVDAFQYVHQPIAGDAQIMARVTGTQNTNQFAKAGVMFRAGTGASDAYVILDVKPDGCVEFMTRPSAGAATTFVATGGNCGTPRWLRLTRAGSTFGAAVSGDGAAWQPIGTTTATLPSAAIAGLAVTSHDNAVLNTATFDNASVAIVSPP